jgi:hypothetical protein
LFLSSNHSQPYFISKFLSSRRSYQSNLEGFEFHLNSNFESTNAATRYYGTRAHSSATLPPLIQRQPRMREPPARFCHGRALAGRAPPCCHRLAVVGPPPRSPCHRVVPPLAHSPPLSCYYKRRVIVTFCTATPFPSRACHGHPPSPSASYPPATAGASPLPPDLEPTPSQTTLFGERLPPLMGFLPPLRARHPPPSPPVLQDPPPPATTGPPVTQPNAAAATTSTSSSTISHPSELHHQPPCSVSPLMSPHALGDNLAAGRPPQRRR